MVQRELVLIIDFGGNEAQLLAQRVRELKVYAEPVSYTHLDVYKRQLLYYDA